VRVGKLKVLLIDPRSGDCPDMREILQGTPEDTSCRDLGLDIEILTVSSASSPSDLIRSDVADAILYRGTPGREFYSILDDCGLSTPVLVVGDADDPITAQLALADGAQEYVPFRSVDRMRLVQALLCARQRARTLRNLQNRERRMDSVLQSAVDGVWDWNLETGSVEFCTRLQSRFGKNCQSISYLDRVHPEDRDGFETALKAHIEGRIGPFRHEHRFQCADRSYRWVLSQGILTEGTGQNPVDRIIGSTTDITDRKREEEKILHAVYHDSLTGLPNRAHFMRCLDRSIARHGRRADYRFAVLFLDLDKFKPVNDQFGHLVGDKLLIEVARRLQLCIRPGDTVARLAGDEFTILLDDISDSSDAFRVSDRIQEILARPINLEGVRVTASASIGITLSDVDHAKADDYIKNADSAMYRAKFSGSARSAMYNSGSQVLAEYRLGLEGAIGQALTRGELFIQYQPIVAMSTHEIQGFEALLRWHHPQRGVLSPHDFLPAAESTGAIIPIGFWMIREALGHIRSWRMENEVSRPITVSVNLSRKQLTHKDLPRIIREALEKSGLDGSSLKLEVSEQTLMDMTLRESKLIDEIGSCGVQLSIDDFGTGYTSLGQLHDLPIESLKIDRSLILGIDVEGACTQLISTIVDLARSLGVGVIAEGVETALQQSKLQALDCSYGQGRFFYSPLDVEDAEALVCRPKISRVLPLPVALMVPEPVPMLAN